MSDEKSLESSASGHQQQLTQMLKETHQRLCYIVKKPDFDGYGFNLHSEKGKPGQYIGKVDENSPAQKAGLNEGDRILEVNGIEIGAETHKQVVQRIKAITNEVRLLVIDPIKEKEQQQKLTAAVTTAAATPPEDFQQKIFSSPPAPARNSSLTTNNSSNSNHTNNNSNNNNDDDDDDDDHDSNKISSIEIGRPTIDIIKMEPNHQLLAIQEDEKSTNNQLPVITSTGELISQEKHSSHLNIILNNEMENFNGSGGGGGGHNRTNGQLNGGAAVAGMKSSSPATTTATTTQQPDIVDSSAVKPTEMPPSPPAAAAAPETQPPAPPAAIPDSIEIKKDLNLPMTAAEMRAKLLAKKKYDPKQDSVDLRKKFEIIQKL